VIDPLHVVTAAHCVFDDNDHAALPSALSIRAGVSNYLAPLATDAEQDRTVAAYRIHPAYVWTGKAGADDVAVLTLSTPLDLSGATVQAVALPPAGSAFPAGATGSLAGFGRQNPTIATNGKLNAMTVTVEPQGACSSSGTTTTGLIDANALELCASSATSGVCDGDSGAALVSTSGTPTLIGVVSGTILSDASANCRAGAAGIFAYVATPEILQFLAGDADPPRAPRDNDSTLLLTWKPPLVVGSTVTCSTGGWSGRPAFSYAFLSAQSGKALQSGASSSYTVPPAAVGSKLVCRVEAANAGGTSLEETVTTPAVRPAPQVRIAALARLAAPPGGKVTFRVTLMSPPGLQGSFSVCVSLPTGVGGRLCRSTHHAGGLSGAFPFTFTLKIRASAPPGVARVAVSAVAGVSTASATTSLVVSAR
jgi:hypothetical protein